MNRLRTSAVALGAALTLVAGLLLTPTAAAADAASPSPSLSPTTPTATAQRAPAHRVPLADATRLRAAAAAAAHRWPVKKRTAVTVPVGEAPAGTPAARRLASAKIVQDLIRGTISATVRLKAAPTAATDSNVVVALGKISDDDRFCNSFGDAAVFWQTWGGGEGAPGLLRNGATMKLIHYPSVDARTDQFDCAYAQTWTYPDDDVSEFETLLDGRSTRILEATRDKPVLKVKAPKKTRAKVKRWQKVKVKVRNTNPRVAAPGVKVAVKGKKITSKVKKVGKLRPGKATTVKVKFRVRPGHKRKAKIVVTTKSVKRTRTLKLR